MGRGWGGWRGEGLVWVGGIVGGGGGRWVWYCGTEGGGGGPGGWGVCGLTRGGRGGGGLEEGHRRLGFTWVGDFIYIYIYHFYGLYQISFGFGLRRLTTSPSWRSLPPSCLPFLPHFLRILQPYKHLSQLLKRKSKPRIHHQRDSPKGHSSVEASPGSHPDTTTSPQSRCSAQKRQTPSTATMNHSRRYSPPDAVPASAQNFPSPPTSCKWRSKKSANRIPGGESMSTRETTSRKCTKQKRTSPYHQHHNTTSSSAQPPFPCILPPTQTNAKSRTHPGGTPSRHKVHHTPYLSPARKVTPQPRRRGVWRRLLCM